MATIYDIGVSATFNVVTAIAFLLVFAVLWLQPVNDRVFFPKWYLRGMRDSPSSAGAAVTKYVNLNVRSYLKFLSWMPAALRMPEDELINHAGLDSVVYLRIYLTGFIAHLTMAYAFTFWTCYVLLREYEIIATMVISNFCGSPYFCGTCCAFLLQRNAVQISSLNVMINYIALAEICEAEGRNLHT